MSDTEDIRTVVLTPDSEKKISESMALSPTTQYTLCSKIGSGGMGVVYLARDKRLGRYVAIKRLNEEALKNPVLRQRFLHEARAVASLNHAYVVHIYELGEDELGPYIVMEYVSGPAHTEIITPGMKSDLPTNLTLERFINNEGAMTADEAVTMVLKIARTMSYAHSKGVIHRDLKPANILLDPSCEPKIVDFGLARLVPSAKSQSDITMEALTVPGEKLLSLGYSAPELETDASTSDARADIYSFGAILYFLLTGRNPRYYREQDVPAFLREVLRRSLETAKEQRFQTTDDFIRALIEAASHGQTTAPTIKTTWRCKWCDAVNPVSTKYCAECGWDGSERCLECGGEIFVGQQYCSACGADCRMYEHVDSIVRQMKTAFEERRFERVSPIAARLHGFEPSGPSGRKIQADAHALVEDASRSILRRTRLSTLIPNELNAENYERAKVFIEEFRTLNEDPHVYEDILQTLPVKQFNRDILRVRQCIRNGDWGTAKSTLRRFAVEYSTAPEYNDVYNMILRHDKRQKRMRIAIVIATLIVSYVLSLPFAGKLSKGEFGFAGQVFYAPARFLGSIPFLGDGLNKYNKWCDNGREIASYFGSHDEDELNRTQSKEFVLLPVSVQERRSEFDTQMNEIAAGRRSLDAVVRVQYRQMLMELLDRRKRLGDYDGVVAVTKELNLFKETAKVGAVDATEIQDLTDMKNRCLQFQEEHKIQIARQVNSTVKKYITALDEMRKNYTQRGNMQLAGVISEEIKRVKALPPVVSADAVLADLTATMGVDAASVQSPIVMPSAAELEQMRKNYSLLSQSIKEIEAKCTDSISDWPRQYRSQLVRLIDKFQASGDFNAWEASTEEMTRFDETGTLSENNVVALPAELREIQLETSLKLSKANVERAKCTKKLFDDYIKKLEERKKSLTMKGEMNMASMVNAELKRIMQNSDYIDASSLAEENKETETNEK